MLYKDKMKWYSTNWKNLYKFEPKSYWKFKKDTVFDKKIQDKLSKDSIKEELKQNKKSKTYNQTWGSRTSLSKFNSEYAKNIITFYTCKNDNVLDLFAGRTRYKICKHFGRNYTGFEINEQYILEDEKSIINDDCGNIDKYVTEKKFDCLFTCPPYWKMEVYSDKENDLSNIKTYDNFIKEYETRFEKGVKYIKENGLIIIVLCDFRINGKFYSFHNDTINIFKKLGWNLYDDIILEMNPSARHCYYAQAITKRRMLTTHEHCLIFHKNTDIDERKFEEDKKSKNIGGLKEWY